MTGIPYFISDRNLASGEFFDCWSLFSTCIFLAAFCWYLGAKILLAKLPA